MKYLPLLLLCFGWNVLNAQSFTWAKNLGGSLREIANDITIDVDGNLYLTGSLRGTADLNPDTSAALFTAGGLSDVFLVKLDPDGNFIWARSWGGPLTDNSSTLAIENAETLRVAGTFSGTIDADPGPDSLFLTAAGSFDIFISQFDTAGNFLGVLQVGGTENDGVNSLSFDATGNFYLGGFFQGAADFDPDTTVLTLTSAGNQDAFVAKYSPAGIPLWAKNWGGPDADACSEMVVDAYGHLYTTGFFETTADLDPGTGSALATSAGSRDFFVTKLDSTGKFVWGNTWGGIEQDNGVALALDATEKVLVTGFFAGPVDFDPGPGTAVLVPAEGRDLYVMKLDTSGGLLWAKNYGGEEDDYSSDLEVGPSGNLYLTGFFTGNLEFSLGGGLLAFTSNGMDDTFFCVLDSSGVLVSLKKAGSPGVDYGLALALDAFENAYTIGNFNDTVDFDPGPDTLLLNSAGNWDFFLQKFSYCGDTSHAAVTDQGCNIYTLPSGNATYNTDGTYIDILTNAAGCDSILTIELDISYKSFTAFSASGCGSYTWNDTTYYESGSYSQVLTSSNGCDSTVSLSLSILNLEATLTETPPFLQAGPEDLDYQWLDCATGLLIPEESNETFEPEMNGNYAVIISEGSCRDTSDCLSTTWVGVEEEALLAGISIYPNPSRGTFKLKIPPQLTGVQMWMVDAMGRIVFEDEWKHSRPAKPSFSLGAGLYFLHLQTPSGRRIAHKIVIE